MAATVAFGGSPDPGVRRGSSGNPNPPKVLNRSLSGDESSRAFFTLQRQATQQHSRDPESPLRRFTRAKDDMEHYFKLLQERLEDSQNFVMQIYQREEGNKDGKVNPIQSLREQASGIQELLKRDHMKVAFFGLTSNGKSTVINALLREKVLPSGMGHTTNCFCSVVGVDESEGYMHTPTSTERQNVKNLRQLAHALHKEHLDPDSRVEIFWPKAKCPILTGEVELIDSPGISRKMDQWITDYCMDADVFVYVHNAVSLLNDTEIDFFHRVSERLSKPNIFILNNYWDMSDEEDPEVKEELKKSIMDEELQFLCKELAVVDKKTASERIFFVSGKEVLSVRMKRQPGTVMEEEGQGLKRGWKERSMEFERFEECFKECVSSSAISTKFEQHYKKGLLLVDSLEAMLEAELQQLTSSIDGKTREHTETESIVSRLQNKGHSLQQSSKLEVDNTKTTLGEDVARKLKSIQKSLPKMIKVFSGTSLSDGASLSADSSAGFAVSSYQPLICEHLDSVMEEELNNLSLRTLAGKYRSTKDKIMLGYLALLQMAEKDMHPMYAKIAPPTFSLVFKCSDICADFVPNVEFSFLRSVGVSGRWLKETLNLEAVFGSVFARGSQILSLMKMEYVIPISILGAGLMLPRIFNWKVLLISGGIYGALYTYNWSTFNPKDEFHKQLASHIAGKMQRLVAGSSLGYQQQVEEKLSMLVSGLQEEVEKKKKEANDKVRRLNADVQRLRNFQQTAKTLKNGTILLRNDFHQFKNHHLSD